MKNNRFISDVLKRYPDFLAVGDYFYVPPVDHILSGFFCEKTPNGAYIYKFLYPLFDRFKIIHLSYSERLSYPDGYIDFSVAPSKNLAEEFSSRIDPYVKDAYEFLSLQSFVSNIEMQDVRLKNPRTKKNYALALIMLDRFEEAKINLDEVIKQFSNAPAYVEDFNDSKEILGLLDESSILAKNLVLSWEKEFKEKYGLK